MNTNVAALSVLFGCWLMLSSGEAKPTILNNTKVGAVETQQQQMVNKSLVVNSNQVKATGCEHQAANRPYMILNNICYIFMHEDLPWDSSRKLCQDLAPGRHGSKLAYVESTALMHVMQWWLNDIYKGFLPTTGFWIGLLQVDTSEEPYGGWAWMRPDGTVDHYANKDGKIIPWKENEPNNNGDYGSLCHDENGFFGACDDDGEAEYQSICQVHV